MLLRLIVAWIGNLVDTMATVFLYTNGLGVEINPISAFLLNVPPVFILIKLVLMTVAIISIWWKCELKIFKIASWILCIEYLLVSVYYFIVFIILYL